MKKVLFATTALVATAGMAAADVKIGGSARFGLTYNDATSTTAVEKRMTINLDGSTSTDSGLELGGRIRLQLVTLLARWTTVSTTTTVPLV